MPLNQPLSAFAACAGLDPSLPAIALDAPLIEATQIARREPGAVRAGAQQKNELSAQLKADGVDYTERMNELDKVT